jgi:L-threonylcarbamoyladenylate synthase
MKYKHYAPEGDLTIVSGDTTKVVPKISELASEKVSNGFRVGIIATDETKDSYSIGGALVMSIGTRRDEATISHNLYDILRRMDREKVSYIYSESFGEGSRGQAIMNRLLKAAGHKQIFV